MESLRADAKVVKLVALLVGMMVETLVAVWVVGKADPLAGVMVGQ